MTKHKFWFEDAATVNVIKVMGMWEKTDSMKYVNTHHFKFKAHTHTKKIVHFLKTHTEDVCSLSS